MAKNIFKWLRSSAVGSKPPGAQAAAATAYQHIFVHPCVINNQPYIVYPKGLAEQAPELFGQLSRYYSAQGYALKEDQRSQSNSSNSRQERRRWAPIVLFTASLLFESSVYADVEVDLQATDSHTLQQIELKLVSNQPVRTQIQQQLGPLTPSPTSDTTQLRSTIANTVYAILLQHYQKQDSDPHYVLDDFKQMANYYSDFPEVIALLEHLKTKNWQLVYDENTWVTTASGNIFEVEKALVHFNTRSAAQLRLNNGCQQNPICIASPADALLHELLHTHSMLVNTREFIAQGGMNNVMYPYKHEYAIITAERSLYASMSKHDTRQRPQRTEHTGRLVKAHCPTCIK
jgi:hypothetical protein